MPISMTLDGWSLALAAGLIALQVGLALAQRERRRRAWLSEPRRLLTPAPPHELIHWACLFAAITVALVASAGAGGWLSFFTCALATLCAFGVFHQGRRRPAGLAAMILLAVMVVSLFRTLGFGGWPAALVGLAWSGAWLLWLAQFWRQQLAPEGAWTSAGRLIAPARIVGMLASAGIVAAAAALATVSGAAVNLSVAWFAWTALGIAAYAVVLTRDARYRAPVESP